MSRCTKRCTHSLCAHCIACRHWAAEESGGAVSKKRDDSASAATEVRHHDDDGSRAITTGTSPVWSHDAAAKIGLSAHHYDFANFLLYVAFGMSACVFVHG